MSGHGHHDASDLAHADDHAHDDETTSDDFPADEPRSPGWLPLLGGALFLAGIFAFVATGSSGKTTEQLAQDAAAANPSASAAASVAAPSPAQRPAEAVPAGARLPPNHPAFPAPAGH